MAGTRTLFLDMLASEVTRPELSHVIRDARAGDEAAFAHIVAEHESLVLRTAWRLVRNREDARDIAQETFLRLHRHLKSLTPDRNLAPWLYRVTVNLGLSNLRRRRRKPEARFDEEILTVEALAAVPQQERQSDAADARRVVASLLDALSEKERAAVVLRDLEGLDIREVAAALGCRTGTVRAHLSRGRLKLRKALEDRGGTP